MAGVARNGFEYSGEDPGALADCPFGIWRDREDLDPGELADFDNLPPSNLEDVGLASFADLYRAVAGVLSPAEADECELWQLAALLGADRREQPDDILTRIAASVPEGDGPVDVTRQIMAAQGISTR